MDGDVGRLAGDSVLAGTEMSTDGSVWWLTGLGASDGMNVSATCETGAACAGAISDKFRKSSWDWDPMLNTEIAKRLP